jgi:DNA-binding NarL/FixJ family response regulator
LLKGAGRSEVLLAIRGIARGEAVFGPGIARRLIGYFGPRTEDRVPHIAFPGLTDREREVLELVAAGRNNREIASELFLSLKTVRNYVSAIFAKLHFADRSQAIIQARQAGLGSKRER